MDMYMKLFKGKKQQAKTHPHLITVPQMIIVNCLWVTFQNFPMLIVMD